MTLCAEARATLEILADFRADLTALAASVEAKHATADGSEETRTSLRAHSDQIAGAVEMVDFLADGLRSGEIEASGPVRRLPDPDDGDALPTRYELCELWLALRRWPAQYPVTISCPRNAVVIEHGMHCIARSLCAMLVSTDSGNLFAECGAAPDQL